MNQNNIIKKYYPQPPLINSVIKYENINKDPNLRKLMTNFYLKKSIKWINKYEEFNASKKILYKIESNSGYEIIYNLLRNFIKKSKTNWYDLKDKDKYFIIKDFLKNMLPTS